MHIDLTAADLKTVTTLLNAYLSGTTVWAFGSRVKFTSKPASDLDLVAFIQPEQESDLADLKEAFAESGLPFKVDILDWDVIPDNFKRNIENDYVVLEQTNAHLKNWDHFSLREICIDISYGYTESASWEKIGPKFLRITDIQNNFINWETVPYCNIAPRNLQKYKLEIGDIVIARTGASTGVTSIFKNDDIEAVYASYLIRFKTNKNIANPFYIGHVLKSPIWKSYVSSIIGGSAQPGANAQQFANFKFLLPPKSAQDTISGIISSLEDKIYLNLQMNQTLESIAQNIFKEWFVNFNFPGFNGKLVNGLPHGWKVKNLGSVIDVKGGTTPSTSVDEYWNGTYYWTTPKDLSNNRSYVLLDTERKITAAGVKQIGSGILPIGTLLLSSRAPVGYLAISQVPVSINQGYIAIQGKNVSNLFMLFWLIHNVDAVKGRANGSTFQEISKTSFKEIETIIPDERVITLFDEVINPIYNRMVANEKENRILIELRDFLLPRLMTGQLKVSA